MTTIDVLHFSTIIRTSRDNLGFPRLIVVECQDGEERTGIRVEYIWNRGLLGNANRLKKIKESLVDIRQYFV